MRKIVLLLIVLLIFSVSCSKKSEDEIIIYNTSDISPTSIVFNVSGNIIYNVGENWKRYNIETQRVSSISIDTTTNLVSDNIVKAFPKNASIVTMTTNLDETYMQVREIDIDSSIPNTIVNNSRSNLIDEEIMDSMMRVMPSEKTNDFCDISQCDLESRVQRNQYFYEDSIYNVSGTQVLKSDVTLKNNMILPITLNMWNISLSFKGELIYYIDAAFNLSVYNQITGESSIVMNGVEDFYMGEGHIYFSSLEDQRYYQKNLESDEIVALHDSENLTFLVYERLFIYQEGTSLYIKYLDTESIELISDSCLGFIAVDSSLYYIDYNNLVEIISLSN